MSKRITIAILCVVVLSLIGAGCVTSPYVYSVPHTRTPTISGYGRTASTTVIFYAYDWEGEGWDQVGSTTTGSNATGYKACYPGYYYSGTADLDDDKYWDVVSSNGYAKLLIYDGTAYAYTFDDSGYVSCMQDYLDDDYSCVDAGDLCKSDESPYLWLMEIYK